ncbi:MAG TPA: hypothetical protein VGL59_21240 [Polyangia bacterium]|jgi:hypothetical protein
MDPHSSGIAKNRIQIRNVRLWGDRRFRFWRRRLHDTVFEALVAELDAHGMSAAVRRAAA